MNISKPVRGVVASLAMMLSLAAVPQAVAEEMNLTVAVPDAPGGARFAGCYSVDQRLYGPYRMDFCLDQRASYTVRGGGVTCNGRINWDATGGTINIDLRRTSCGNGVAWSSDSMECRGTRIFGNGIAGTIGNALARRIAPGIPTLVGLSCTYYPDAPGKKPTLITATRQS